MKVKQQTLSIAEFQNELEQLPEQLKEGLEAINVMQDGKLVMMVVSPDSYKEMEALQKKIKVLQDEVEGLQETMEILQDEETMEAFRQSVKEIEAGETLSLDDVLKELGWEEEDETVEG